MKLPVWVRILAPDPWPLIVGLRHLPGQENVPTKPSPLPCRLMVGQAALNRSIEVRILARQLVERNEMKKPEKIPHALESLVYELWNEGGEDAVKDFGLILPPRGRMLIESKYNGNRVRFRDGRRILQTSFGDILLADVRDLY